MRFVVRLLRLDVTENPSNKRIMQHYIEKLGAEEFPISNGYAYTIVLWEDVAKNLVEEYDYEKQY